MLLVHDAGDGDAVSSTEWSGNVRLHSPVTHLPARHDDDDGGDAVSVALNGLVMYGFTHPSLIYLLGMMMMMMVMLCL